LNTSPQNIRKLIVCEGEEDRIFFHQLIEKRGLQKFQILNAGSKDNFCNSLIKYKLERTDDFQRLEHIVFVADNEDNPQDRFDNVCTQIDRVFGPNKCPKLPRETVGQKPKITILMIPWDGEQGHLELLCQQSAKTFKGSVTAAIDQFLATVNADKWHNNKTSKAWLRSFLAIVADDPFIPLGKAIREPKPKDMMPMEHKSFDRVAGFIEKLS
jgi:hypothetical protein